MIVGEPPSASTPASAIAGDLAQHAERVVEVVRGGWWVVGAADLLLLAAQCLELSAHLLPERRIPLTDLADQVTNHMVEA